MNLKLPLTTKEENETHKVVDTTTFPTTTASACFAGFIPLSDREEEDLYWNVFKGKKMYSTDFNNKRVIIISRYVQ